MIKGAWQETLCTFFNTSCIIQFFCSSRVWILLKPSVTESCCQFLLAPSSYCGLERSTRKITTLISSTAAALWCFLCFLWPVRLVLDHSRGHTGSSAQACSAGRAKAALLPSPPPILHVGGKLRHQALHIVHSSCL